HFLTRPFDYGVEWICDSPITANWRLKQPRSPGCHPWALRMAYYGPEVAEELERRQHRINAALADILREETERGAGSTTSGRPAGTKPKPTTPTTAAPATATGPPTSSAATATTGHGSGCTAPESQRSAARTGRR